MRELMIKFDLHKEQTSIYGYADVSKETMTIISHISIIYVDVFIKYVMSKLQLSK